jgi:hypothetical protein
MIAIPDSWREPFPESEIPFIVSGLLRCMATIRKNEPCELETSINTRLWRKLQLDSELRSRPTHLDPEAWELNQADPEGKIGRIDLRFLLLAPIKPTPFFAIEAKRLHVTFPSAGWKSLVSDYVTTDTAKAIEDEQGMMCFISGRYSRGLAAGAMLGYVFDGDVAAARNSVATAIKEHEKKLKIVSPGWVLDSPIQPGSGISESLHDLTPQTDSRDLFRGRFTLYHLFVPV